MRNQPFPEKIKNLLLQFTYKNGNLQTDKMLVLLQDKLFYIVVVYSRQEHRGEAVARARARETGPHRCVRSGSGCVHIRVAGTRV